MKGNENTKDINAKWLARPSKHCTFEIVPGFFVQSDPSTDAKAVGPLPPHFGLLDSSPRRWGTFREKVKALQESADKEGKGVLYKVVFAGRHGQGWHNAAQSKYGDQAWDDYWSKLNGDGIWKWGPDPELTPLGETQAQTVNALWHAEIKDDIPLPDTLYSSPLSRSANTLRISFVNVIPTDQSPLIVENIRETMGVHTCDQRETRTFIHNAFCTPSSLSRPFDGPVFHIEEGFTEQDELYNPDVRESDEEEDIRSRDVLERIFESDKGTYISITAHSGWISSLVRVVNHRRYELPTGGVIPMVIKATPV